MRILLLVDMNLHVVKSENFDSEIHGLVACLIEFAEETRALHAKSFDGLAEDLNTPI